MLMNVDQYIGELLYDYECVILPGLGGFISNKKSANVNKITHQFFPPFYQLFFNVHLTDNDGLLINYVAKREGISFTEAKAAVDDYVEECKRVLQAGEFVTVKNIGSLSRDSSGNIYFRQETSINYNPDAFGLSEFVSPLVKRQTDEERIKGLVIPLKKDKIEKPEQKAVTLGNRNGLRRLMTRAAIFILLVSTISWGLINKDEVGSYITEYASVNPFAKKTPQYQPRQNSTPFNDQYIDEADQQSSIEVTEQATPALSEDNTSTVVLDDPGPVEVAENSPATVTAEISPATSKTVEPEITTPEPKEPKAKVDHSKTVVPAASRAKQYYIIAGSFESEKNANKLVAQLRQKGYNALIADTNKYGMYRVAYDGIPTLKLAKEKLSAIRNEDNAEAWVLKK